MALKHCGGVDAEEGLLLFGDAATLQLWRGSEDEQTHFTRMEAAVQKGLPGLSLLISEETGVLWDLEGPGTTDIFCNETADKITLIRCWLAYTEEEDAEAVLALLSAPVALGTAFAAFEVKTGFLALLSAAESGSCLQSSDGSNYSVSQQEMMTESSGMILPVAKGHYDCYYDAITTAQGEARRCHLIRAASAGY